MPESTTPHKLVQYADGKAFVRRYVRLTRDGSIVSMQHYIDLKPVSRADYNDALTTAELNEINRNAGVSV